MPRYRTCASFEAQRNHLYSLIQSEKMHFKKKKKNRMWCLHFLKARVLIGKQSGSMFWGLGIGMWT